MRIMQSQSISKNVKKFLVASLTFMTVFGRYVLHDNSIAGNL